MTTELETFQNRLDPHLKKGDFSFIGPADEKLLTRFFDVALDYAPPKHPDEDSSHYLSNKDVIDSVISDLPAGISLKLYEWGQIS